MAGASRSEAMSPAVIGVAVTSRPRSMNARAAFDALKASKSASPDGPITLMMASEVRKRRPAGSRNDAATGEEGADTRG